MRLSSSLLLCALLTALAVVVSWQSRSSNNADKLENTNEVSPALEFDSTSIDLGPISSESEPIIASFQVRNQRDHRVGLKLVSKSCACADAALPEFIGPNEQARIAVSVDPRRKSGAVLIRVVVETEPSDQKSYEVRVLYDGIPRIAVLPEVLTVEETGTEAIEREMIVTVRTERGAVSSAPIIELSNDQLVADLIEKADPFDKSLPFRRISYRYRLVWNPLAEVTKSEAIKTINVAIRAGSSEPTMMQMNIIGRHHPTILGPTALILDRDSNKVYPIRLWSRHRQPIAIERVVVPDDSVTLDEIDHQEKSIQELKFRHHNSSKEGRRGTIRVHLKGIEQPYLLELIIRK